MDDQVSAIAGLIKGRTSALLVMSAVGRASVSAGNFLGMRGSRLGEVALEGPARVRCEACQQCHLCISTLGRFLGSTLRSTDCQEHGSDVHSPKADANSKAQEV